MGEREYGLRQLLLKAATEFKDQGILQIPFNVKDRGAASTTEYSMCYNRRQPQFSRYVGPDWVCFWWRSANIHSYERCVQECIAAGQEQPVINKVAWFGNINSPLSDVPEFTTRPLLAEMGRIRPDLLEIQHVPPQGGVIDGRIRNYMTLHEMIRKYKYLLDIGGNGYSGRLKFLLFSRRPVFIVERDYIEYWHNQLIPYEHYIPVREDLSDLLVQINWAEANPTKCQEITAAALKFAQENLTTVNFTKRIFEVYQNLKQQ